MSFVTRFAPSPTGFLHLGHAFSALLINEMTKRHGGTCMLRIEDIDHTRCRSAYDRAILDDLSWLGLKYPEPVLRQSENMGAYQTSLNKLIDGGLLYRCFRTRREILQEIENSDKPSAMGPDGPVFAGGPLPTEQERTLLEQQKPFAWRLNLSAAKSCLRKGWAALEFSQSGLDPGTTRTTQKAMPEIFGDAIVARKDIGTSYHLASVYDDAKQGITHVIRGKDLAEAPHIHTLLQVLLGLPAPIYLHHRLIVDADGKKFSKSEQAPSLKDMREKGCTPSDIRKILKQFLDAPDINN